MTVAVTGLAFVALFYQPMFTLARDWWTNPDAGHGLLLGPLALYLAGKSGLRSDSRPAPLIGGLLLAAAILVRYASGLAAELFTMRMSMLVAVVALTVYYRGFRQVMAWWLPLTLLVLSVPLPAVILNTLAFPLQLKASEMGATLLEWRHVPVLLSGNVIHLPGQSLFVTEACSGLRSLAALLSLGVLTGGLWLQRPWTRVLLVALAIPVAILLNGIRVFLTGFLVYFVSPAAGEGLMHLTEGWVIFVVAFGILGLAAWSLSSLESRLASRRGAVA